MKKKLTLALCMCTVLLNFPVYAETTENKVANEAQIGLGYTFDSSCSDKAGYAQGTITITVNEAGKYYLYWANDNKTLEGYYAIANFDIKQGETATFNFSDHTAIPIGATKLIAVKADKEADAPVAVSDAKYSFDIPKEKQLTYRNGDALYTFNSYSDIHIDEEKWGSTPGYWWEFSEDHWAKALQYAVDKNVDFIISSGDQVTNASFANLDKEWKAYQYILSQSDYVNPIWESSGNHEVRQDDYVSEGLQYFIKGTGLDSSQKEIAKNKPYYYLTEPSTGDLFIFMALENGYRPSKYDEFSDEQLEWLENLLSQNYSKGKNIYLIQHALISKYGAGDDTENPYYSGSINPDLESAKKFKEIIEKYPNIIWISGHTHEDFNIGNNYSNNNGTSCNMIHNSSIGNPTQISSSEEHALDYSFIENNSQGYYVQAFKDAIIFNGANVCDEKIYPSACYIIDGNTSKAARSMNNTKVTLTQKDVTSGMLNSTLANVKTILGVNYEFSSYDQYQALKKYYYQYKDVNTATMSSDELKEVYSKLSKYISDLCTIVSEVDKLEK